MFVRRQSETAHSDRPSQATAPQGLSDSTQEPPQGRGALQSPEAASLPAQLRSHSQRPLLDDSGAADCTTQSAETGDCWAAWPCAREHP